MSHLFRESFYGLMEALLRPGRRFERCEFQTAKAADELQNLVGWSLQSDLTVVQSVSIFLRWTGRLVGHRYKCRQIAGFSTSERVQEKRVTDPSRLYNLRFAIHPRVRPTRNQTELRSGFLPSHSEFTKFPVTTITCRSLTNSA